MARQKNIKPNNKERPDVKRNWLYILALSALLLYVSYVIDESVRSAFENVKFPMLDFFFGIMTNFGVMLAIFLGIPLVILHRKGRKASYFLILAFISSFLFSFALKLIALRQRPVETLYYPLTSIINYSFPSMHSMVVFALLPFLMHFMPRQRHFWAIFAFLTAFTRIYFGFHYLSDVVFGIIVGYLIGRLLLAWHNKGAHGEY